MARSRLHFQCSGHWMTLNHPGHEEEQHGSAAAVEALCAASSADRQ